MVDAATVALPEAMAHLARRGDEPPQNLKEYDPEWARAFLSGTATINCDHAQMLRRVKVPVLFTHHFRQMPIACRGKTFITPRAGQRIATGKEGHFCRRFRR